VASPKVLEVMTKRIVTIAPSQTVLEAAKKMARARVSTLIVVEEGKPIGIFTESDIVKKVVAKNLLPSSIKVGSIMTPKIIAIASDATVDEAKEMMARFKVRRLPVIDRLTGKLVGILTVTDLARLYPGVSSLMKPRPRVISREPVSGICERCYNYSDDLRLVDGEWLCETCREAD